MFPAEWLRTTASEVGCVQRNRKVDPVVLFWVLVMGFGVGVQRSIASLRRAYESVSGETLVPSSFYDRFNKKLIAFLKRCLVHGIAELANHTSLVLSEKLKGFKDLIVADGTVIRLHEKLAGQYPGTRGKAELKIHTVIGVTGNTKSVRFYPGNTAEIKTMRIGPWVKDHILLFDLGYFKFQLFSRIRRNGGYFVSRLKDTANPTVVSVLRTHRGRSIDLEGKKLRDVLPRLKREVIDVEVEVNFHRRPYKGTSSKATETFRLIGMLNPETNEYHLYMTNLSPEQLSAEDVAQLYKARWSIELVFKELKRLYKLDVISSAENDVVECLVLVAMLTLVVSHRVLNHMRRLAPEKSERFTPLRWAETFYSAAPFMVSRVLEVAGIDVDPFTAVSFFMSEAIDPNVNRERLLDDWVSAANV
ncbi:MAG: IS4 family transposase [Alicyclobacillus sp.]|nr:IS4 family transposase [Alicyclobacillus sp.]